MNTRKKGETKQQQKTRQRLQSLQRSLEPEKGGGLTSAAAEMMTEPLGGRPAKCTITGHCQTSVYKFPGSYLITNGPMEYQIIYSQNDFKAAIVSNLPAYFEQKPEKSIHYAIDVSLRAGIHSTYQKANERSSREIAIGSTSLPCNRAVRRCPRHHAKERRVLHHRRMPRWQGHDRRRETRSESLGCCPYDQ